MSSVIGLPLSPIYVLAPIIYIIIIIPISLWVLFFYRHDYRIQLIAGFTLIASSIALIVATNVAPASKTCYIIALNNTTSIEKCAYTYKVNLYSMFCMAGAVLGFVHLLFAFLAYMRSISRMILAELP